MPLCTYFLKSKTRENGVAKSVKLTIELNFPAGHAHTLQSNEPGTLLKRSKTRTGCGQHNGSTTRTIHFIDSASVRSYSSKSIVY